MMLLRRRNMMGAAKSLEGALGSLAVGTLVTLKGVGNFIVVHQGNPDSSIYHASCNGTWLLMADCYNNANYKTRYDASSSNYPESTVANYVNTTFYNLFSNVIKENIRTVKIPYHDPDAEMNNWLDNGYECKVFLPSPVEYGIHSEDAEIDSNENVPTDGACLDYFVGTSPQTGVADDKRATSGWHWHRTPYTTVTNYVWATSGSGLTSTRIVTQRYAIRPMLIMDKYTPIDGDEIAIVE